MESVTGCSRDLCPQKWDRGPGGRNMTHGTQPRDEAPVPGFISIDEFPLSEQYKEGVLRLTKLAKSGEGHSQDEDDDFEAFVIEHDRELGFPTQEELKKLPSWKTKANKQIDHRSYK